MRIIVMLRPTNKRGTKMPYTAFRKLLASEGFVLLQPEVFMRVSPTRAAAEQIIRRVAPVVPQTGTVCLLTLTERQYASARYLTGGPGAQELLVGARVQVEL